MFLVDSLGTLVGSLNSVFFSSTDSHFREWWSSNIQPQPGRQHQQIPWYHLSYSQGKMRRELRLSPWDRAEPCVSCDCQMRAFAAVWITTAHIYLAHSEFHFAAFSSTYLSSVWFPCAHSSSLPVSVWSLYFRVYLFFCFALTFCCPVSIVRSYCPFNFCVFAFGAVSTEDGNYTSPSFILIFPEKVAV